MDETTSVGEKTPPDIQGASPSGGAVLHLNDMYRKWWLEYASYVTLDRAVPHIIDGLKPVQRRILHTMQQLDDGRYNKVANIVGSTMQYHPHGDASIGDALVNMGQKDLLIDTQGNWGNILTGDTAAASRYIEARLSKFALETVFDPKVTEWQLSYDGRKKEPITLPIKFPLVLVHGARGISVTLSTEILPHNFNEVCDAAVAYLRGEEFNLYPDFQTGGSVDVSKYNDGARGGRIKARAKISKLDNKTLVITELPYSQTTPTLIESILKAADRGKIRIKKIDDNTASEVEILITLASATSADKTIDALYAFTGCEVSVSPNCCVIDDHKPQFLSVSDVLRRSVDNTREILRRELEIRANELREQLHFASLEKIFIEERIYKDKEYEQAQSNDAACEHIDNRLTPYYPQMIREVTKDDILRLLEIRMKRILRFNANEAELLFIRLKEDIAAIEKDLADITGYTIRWFERLKKKYGDAFPRRTELRNFDNIEAAKVVEANEKLYINRTEGFIGTSLKKDEYVANCSDIDDVLLFYKDGKYKIVKVQEKLFVGKNVMYVNVFKKNDSRTVYNTIYRDGKTGAYFMKRFTINNLIRDKEYDTTQGKDGSRIVYFTANPNGEAETVKVKLKFNPRLKKQTLDVDFSQLAIKNRSAQGNLVTRLDVERITLKERGGSTLGGLKVWYEQEVRRLNYDGRGTYIGEFQSDDTILVVLANGDYYTTNFDITNHYEGEILRIEKYDPDKVWTAVLRNADEGNYPYLKRFLMEAAAKTQNFIGENSASQLINLSAALHPKYLITYGEGDSFRPALEVNAEEFIAIKGYKAKGKRLTTYIVANIELLNPDETVDEDNSSDTPDSEVQIDDETQDNTMPDTLDNM